MQAHTPSLFRGRAEMPHRLCPDRAGQEPGAVEMHQLSQLLVRVHETVRLAQARILYKGIQHNSPIKKQNAFEVLE